MSYCQCSPDELPPTGSFSYAKVPQGKYYLIIAGDQPDGTTQFSGSVNMEFSGTPSP